MDYYQGIYQKDEFKPYRLSRSKIEDFVRCPRCFYLDRRFAVRKPSIPTFTLNNAVDELLKKEFDIHRLNGEAHPLMKAYGLDAVPLKHNKMDEWRDALYRGAAFLHKPTNFYITGGIDDLWINKNNELIIVDYKATSTDKEISLEDKWKDSYKRQAEVYQWLFKQNGFRVFDTAYFVYCNGLKDKKAFDAKLEFKVQIIPYQGDSSWVEPKLMEIKKVLDADEIPQAASDCELCNYVKNARKYN